MALSKLMGVPSKSRTEMTLLIYYLKYPMYNQAKYFNDDI